MTNASALPREVHLMLRAGGDTDWRPQLADEPGAQVRVSVCGEADLCTARQLHVELVRLVCRQPASSRPVPAQLVENR